MTLRRASRGVRFGEMGVLSQVFVVVWAAEPQLPGARRGHGGDVSAVRAPVEHGSTGRKAFGDNVLRVVERAQFSGCAARRGVAGAVRPAHHLDGLIGGEEFRTDRGRSCRVVRGSVGDEAERAFFFLRVVQPENGVQPVEQAAEFDDVLGFGAVRVEPVEQSS